MADNLQEKEEGQYLAYFHLLCQARQKADKIGIELMEQEIARIKKIVNKSNSDDRNRGSQTIILQEGSYHDENDF